jgi:hypothetical protein
MLSSETFQESLYNFSKKAYWVIGLGIVVGICYYLYNVAQKPIASILLFMGGFLLIYFYWIKWFKLPEQNPSWPPTVNPCPDYLSPVVVTPPGGGTPTVVCKDYVGISSNGIFEKSAPGTTDTNNANANFYPPSRAENTSNEDFSITMVNVCNNVRDSGLSWLGVCPEE